MIATIYDPTAGYIETPAGPALFVHYDARTSVVYAEHDHRYIVGHPANQCYIMGDAQPDATPAACTAEQVTSPARNLRWDLLLLSLIGLVCAILGRLLLQPPPEPAQVEPAVSASAVRQQMDAQLAQIDAMIEADKQLVTDLQAIAPLVPPEYRRLVVDVARANGLDPHDLAALGYVETRWDCTQVGAAGEIGCLQVMPDTAAWVASQMGVTDYDLTQPEWNVAIGAFYLRHLLNDQGSLDAALAAYNAGPAWQERAPRTARGYVDRIRAARQLLVAPTGGN